MEKVPYINSKNFRSARKNVGLTTEEATKKITPKSKKDTVLLWESGDLLPTWKQLETIAKHYSVNSFLLMSEEILEENKQIPDYRTGIDNKDKESVKKLVNLVIDRQRWLRERFLGLIPKNKLIGSGKNLTSPQKLALFIKEKLEIDFDKIKTESPKNKRSVLKYLISQAEKQGIFVGKTISYHRIEVKNMRGLFIADEYAPFIILNRRDSWSAQIFSFIHELSHFFRETEAISNNQEFRKKAKNVNKEEIFCNQVAIEFLLPKEDVILERYSKQQIIELSEKFKISTLATFYRLKDLKKVDPQQADNLEREFKRMSEEYLIQKALEKERKKQAGKSGGNAINNMRDSNGRLFESIVSSAYHQNRIDYVEASNLLKYSAEKSYE
jgi:Zn-dependent peptidase ImmA (M78 family)/DNA-binding XRE family transcriptional regulator